jgi:hypothetical protein
MKPKAKTEKTKVISPKVDSRSARTQRVNEIHAVYGMVRWIYSRVAGEAVHVSEALARSASVVDAMRRWREPQEAIELNGILTLKSLVQGSELHTGKTARIPPWSRHIASGMTFVRGLVESWRNDLTVANADLPGFLEFRSHRSDSAVAAVLAYCAAVAALIDVETAEDVRHAYGCGDDDIAAAAKHFDRVAGPTVLKPIQNAVDFVEVDMLLDREAVRMFRIGTHSPGEVRLETAKLQSSHGRRYNNDELVHRLVALASASPALTDRELAQAAQITDRKLRRLQRDRPQLKRFLTEARNAGARNQTAPNRILRGTKYRGRVDAEGR